MKNITIPIEISSDLLIILNESEKELKSHIQLAISLMLFQEGKLTLGKAVQLSGLSRTEFEKTLVKNKISVSTIDQDQIISDVEKLKFL